MIGVPQPSSIYIELNKNQDRIDDIIQGIMDNVDLSPSGINKRFDGGFPRYYNTALHGHYGKTDEEMKDAETAKLYPWEKTDLVGGLLHFLNT
jgi:S-adenosylmethionine synthetase